MITNFFRGVREAENSGVSMGPGPAWKIGPVKDAPAFFRGLLDLLPDNSILYLEDVCSKEGVTLLTRLAVEPRLKIVSGTIWPRPNFFHIPFNSAVAGELAEFAKHHATPEIGIHVHAYRGEEILLEWYDAFGAPLRMATSLPEASIRKFCDLLHCNCAIEQFSHDSQQSSSRDKTGDHEAN